MKWLFAEAHVVIISNNTPFIILHLIRFKQISQMRTEAINPIDLGEKELPLWEVCQRWS
jgi:hypothetical protein